MRFDLRKVVRRLPRRSRDLVRLRYGWQCDSRETALRLGYRYSGIYTITKRCLAAMAKELEDLGYLEDARANPRSATAGQGGEELGYTDA